MFSKVKIEVLLHTGLFKILSIAVMNCSYIYILYFSGEEALLAAKFWLEVYSQDLELKIK